MDNIVISVITAVYNRADTVHRVFESLERSTYRNFELVMVDDGSTDNIVEVVEYYKKTVTYPVIFLRKENGGKHTAINLMYEMVRGEYVFTLDSDDELIPDAMEKSLRIWEGIPIQKRNEYWCVCGRHKYSDSSNMIGTPFPDNINNHDLKKSKKIASKINGDKMSLQKVAIVQKYKFPEPKYVNFVTEKIVWNRIDMEYKQYYTNEIFGIVYSDAVNRLTHTTRNMQSVINNYFNCLYMINNSFALNIGIKEYLVLQVRYSLNASMILEDIAISIGKLDGKHKLISILTTPISILMIPRYKRKYNLKVSEDE